MKKDITILEKALGYSLSDQQKAILNRDLTKPTGITAVAGAGKTTTMILDIIHQQDDPVLGITFSKKAQLDMQKRFSELANETKSLNLKPHFSTFHSLFFNLLRQLYPKVKFNVVSPNNFIFDLYKQIDEPIIEISPRENVERFTDIMGKLINLNYAPDSLHVNLDNNNVKTIISQVDGKNPLDSILTFLGMTNPIDRNTYVKIVKRYHTLKKQNHALDFDDMQAILLTSITKHKSMQENVKRYLSRFKRVYVDEYQDINPISQHLLKLILPSNLYNTIVLIGDDDQSIYSFRGSSSKFILNLTKNFTNIQMLRLSTNYRTSKNILDVAKKSVETNTLRLTKDIKAFNDGGSVKISLRSDANDPALAKLKEDSLKSDETFAILARNNIDLAFATDKLANLDIFARVKQKSIIFQNQTVTRIFLGLMKAVGRDDAKSLIDYAQTLGFSTLKKSLRNLAQSNAELQKSTKKLLEAYSLHHPNDNRIEDLRSLQTLIENLSESDNYSNETAVMTLNRLVKATDNYFEYMIENGFGNFDKRTYENTIIQLQNSAQNKSLKAFLADEDFKQVKLENEINSSNGNIEALTMHAAKGLEYDHVLIFDEATTGYSDDAIFLANLFPANFSRQDMLTEITSFDNNEMKQAIVFALANINSFALHGLLKRWFGKMDLEKIIKMLKSKSNVNINSDVINFDILLDNKQLADLLYLELKNNADNIEEEHRVYYVAGTRARKELTLDIETNLSSGLSWYDLNKIEPDKKEESNNKKVDNKEKKSTNEIPNIEHIWDD